MKIRVLGSGSGGNSTLIQSGSANILIDAGFSARELERRLLHASVDPSSLSAVVITHEHIDHIRALCQLTTKYRINLFASERCLECSSILTRNLSSFHTLEEGVPFNIGTVGIHPFSLPHDADETFGFTFASKGCKVSYATDLGFASETVAREMKNSDAIVVEANHDIGMLMNGPYPWFLKKRLMGKHGHLSNRSMAELVEGIVDESTRFLILAHLSRTNNRPEIALREAKNAASKAGARMMSIIASSQWRSTEMISL